MESLKKINKILEEHDVNIDIIELIQILKKYKLFTIWKVFGDITIIITSYKYTYYFHVLQKKGDSDTETIYIGEIKKDN